MCVWNIVVMNSTSYRTQCLKQLLSRTGTAVLYRGLDQAKWIYISTEHNFSGIIPSWKYPEMNSGVILIKLTKSNLADQIYHIIQSSAHYTHNPAWCRLEIAKVHFSNILCQYKVSFTQLQVEWAVKVKVWRQYMSLAVLIENRGRHFLCDNSHLTLRLLIKCNIINTIWRQLVCIILYFSSRL